MLGANPFASNGSLMTAPDMPGRLRALRARGGRLVVVDPRRTKTAEEADEHLVDPARHRRAASCSRSCTCCSPRTSSTSGRSPTHVERARRGARGSRTSSRPSASRRRAASTPTTIRRIARELAGAPTRRGLRAHRHVHAGVRHARVVARRRAQRAHRQPRPAGRRDVHASPRRAARNTGGTPGNGRGVRFGRRQLTGARAARVLRRAPGRVPRRGDRDAGRRPDPRADHDRRQPRRLHARLRTGSTARSASLDFMVSVDIYLNETTRHADVILPARAGARARPLRPRALQPRDPQRRELLAAAASSSSRARCRSGRSCCGSAAIARRVRAPTPTSTRSTTSSSPGSCRRRCTRRARTSKAATPTSC